MMSRSLRFKRENIAGDPMAPFLAYRVRGTLSAAREAIATCRVSIYRRKRSHGAYYDADSIIMDALDSIDQTAYDDGEALRAWNEDALEWLFNSRLVLIVDKIEVSPQHRGNDTWKRLYFDTLRKALEGEPVDAWPSEYFFKVYPLDHARMRPSEIDKAVRALRRLYALHLGARALDLPASHGCYMRAPLPRPDK